MLLIKTHVTVYRYVYRIVRHVQKPRLVVFFRLIKRLNSLLGKRFCGESAGTPVFFKSGNGKGRNRCAILPVTEVFFAEICCKPSRRATCYIGLETEMHGVFSRSVNSAEMSFAAMDGVIAGSAQILHKRAAYKCIVYARHHTDAVVVPFGRCGDIRFLVSRAVAVKSPVGDFVASGVSSGDKTAPRRRANGTRISRCKLHAACRKPFHIRSQILTIVGCDAVGKRHRSILPTHIIYHEQKDIGSFVLSRRVQGASSQR